MGVVEKAAKVAATAGALGVVINSVFKGEWDEATGKLLKVRFLYIPVYDARRREARLARRAARRAAKAKE